MTDQQPDTKQPNTFWAEGRRRGVFRVGGLYVAGAFVILQLGEIVLPAFNAPDWALQTLVVFVFLGLPVALAFSWVYDLSPEGLKRTRSLVPVGGRSLVPGLALLGVTALSAGLGAWWFSRSAMGTADTDTGPGAPSSSPAAFASLDPAAPITAIAVLPLAHFAEGDDLFARQLHDEIITRLSELTTLRVVSRTSVERYRTTDMLLPEIAAELRVQAIVTGSVAMTGENDSVRISIQLLHAPSDTHMESLTWQREMKDILRLQTEIAVEIATLVQGELRTPDVEVDRIAQVDPEAHRAFLRGRDELDRGTPEAWRAALEWFDQAIELDSAFAPARAWRAGAHLLELSHADSIPSNLIAMVQEDLQLAEELGGAADEVATAMVILDDHLGEGGEGAHEALPSEVRDVIAEVRTSVEGTDQIRRQYLLDATRFGRSLGPQSPLLVARRLLETERYDSAEVVYRNILEDDPSVVPAWAGLEDLYLRQGDYAGAVEVREDWILATRGDSPDTRAAVQQLRTAFAPEAPATYWQWRQVHTSDRQARGERVSEVELAMVAMGLGDADAALDHLRAAVGRRDPALMTLRTSPVWDPLRDDSRFREIVQRARELWRGGRGQGRERERGAEGGRE